MTFHLQGGRERATETREQSVQMSWGADSGCRHTEMSHREPVTKASVPRQGRGPQEDEQVRASPQD